MAQGYRPVVRDQQFLLPPDMADWLPDDHLVWFVLDTVAVLDTSPLHARAARLRDGGQRRNTAGRAGYDPQMLVGLLLYAYCCGRRSSREIERLCSTDVAFRIACAGDVPDHSVLARFRQAHADSFAALFAQVLRLCRDAGMARLGTVAIDGTKIAADASRQANRGRDWLTREAIRLDNAEAGGEGEQPRDQVSGEQAVAAEVLAEADRVDAAEDAATEAAGATGRPGPHDHGRPPGWSGRAGRRERLRAAIERITAVDTARTASTEQARVRTRQRDEHALDKAEQALVVEQSRQQDKIDAWEQAWEHATATCGPVPRGRSPRPIDEASAVRRAVERVERARYRLAHPDTAPRPGGNRTPPQQWRGRRDRNQPARANVTDPDSSLMPSQRGWVQGYNAQVAVTADQIIWAIEVGNNPADVTYYDSMTAQVTRTADELDATDEIGTLLFDAGYASIDTLTAEGPNQLIALGKTRSMLRAARADPADGPPPAGATPAEAMDHRLRTPEGATLYTRRGATVEPAIGNLKKLITRFARRGLTAARTELDLAATAFNLRKLHQQVVPR